MRPGTKEEEWGERGGAASLWGGVRVRGVAKGRIRRIRRRTRPRPLGGGGRVNGGGGWARDGHFFGAPTGFPSGATAYHVPPTPCPFVSPAALSPAKV
ncbi:hypothetical protein GCM10018782_40210 [Streptomyces griseoaurantiacus]|nr:hypothetical protein GCM10018782_40210 [Streptomyces griseoaurantiacus]